MLEKKTAELDGIKNGRIRYYKLYQHVHVGVWLGVFRQGDQYVHGTKHQAIYPDYILV